MAIITDEYMREMHATTKTYTAVLLKAAAGYREPGADKIIWEHGRRNYSLRADGVLAIVCPVADDSDLCGVAIFDADAGETARIMDDDPAVQAGVFTYEVHPVRSFPGDCLPA